MGADVHVLQDVRSSDGRGLVHIAAEAGNTKRLQVRANQPSNCTPLTPDELHPATDSLPRSLRSHSGYSPRAANLPPKRS
jgi:hypothetical protein